MHATFKSIVWQQFGAAIDMLENALNACPEKVWGDRSLKPEFWYTVYHTLFWLDLYLSESRDTFRPPSPFTLDELDPAGLLPDRVYTKDELLTYLSHCRSKCRTTLDAMTDEKAKRRFVFSSGELSVAELMLYNMRHVQHHAGQLHTLLRQTTDSAPRWVRQAKS